MALTRRALLERIGAVGGPALHCDTDLMQFSGGLSSDYGLQVFVGAETAMQALSGSSVVGASYGPDETPIGALAVIGPMRMNYGKVMSVVDFTADTVSQLLAELGRGGNS